MEFSVMMGILMEGFALTAEIFLITLVGSLPLGVVVALARRSKFKPLAWLAQLYISIPVSYTHLDVYKRQSAACSPMRPAWARPRTPPPPPACRIR